MSTTQTLSVPADLADLIDLDAYEFEVAPATQVALAAWRSTVLPHACPPVLPPTSARRVTVTAAPSYTGLTAVAASLLGVGGLLVHALSSLAGV